MEMVNAQRGESLGLCMGVGEADYCLLNSYVSVERGVQEDPAGLKICSHFSGTWGSRGCRGNEVEE